MNTTSSYRKTAIFQIYLRLMICLLVSVNHCYNTHFDGDDLRTLWEEEYHDWKKRAAIANYHRYKDEVVTGSLIVNRAIKKQWHLIWTILITEKAVTQFYIHISLRKIFRFVRMTLQLLIFWGNITVSKWCCIFQKAR